MLIHEKYGWKVFPAIWKNGKHQPLVAWGTESSDNPDVIAGWRKKWPKCYLCVGAKMNELTVVDVDNKKGKNGDASLAALEIEFGSLPDTLRVRTPSGNGSHIIMNGGAARNTVGVLGEGLDTPVMIPVPGSSVEGKGEYRVLSDPGIKTTPGWIYSAIGEVKRSEKFIPDASIDYDTEQNIDRASAYLAGCIPAVEGDRGDTTTFQTACCVKDLAISPEKCLDLMLQLWNDRCSPPWRAEDLERIVGNAYKYGRGDIGASSAEADFGPRTEPAAVAEKKKKARVSVEAIHISEAYSEMGPIDWLIEDYLEKESFTTIFGAKSGCKSFIAVSMAAAIVSGAKWYGNPVKSGPVLYVAGEGVRGITRRFSAWEKKNGVKLSDFPLYITRGAARILDPVQLAELKAIIELRKPILVVLDTLARNFGGDENSASDMNEFVSIIDNISKTECAKIIVHHTGVGDQGRSRGSSVLPAAADFEYKVTSTNVDMSASISMECVKSKDSEIAGNMVFSKEKVLIAVTPKGEMDSLVLNVENSRETKDEKRARLDTEISNLLDEGLSIRKIARQIGEKDGYVQRAKKRLEGKDES